MFKTLFRIVAAFVLGLIVSFALIFGVEIASNILHPFPSDFTGTAEENCMHVARYPNWILVGVVAAWGLTAAVGTWIAGRVGNIYSSAALAILLIAGVVMNISMLPYPVWFKFVISISVPIMALVGAKVASQRSNSLSDPNQKESAGLAG